jgi:hypothetical protein
MYLGSHAHGPKVFVADLDRVTNSHYDLLGSFCSRWAAVLSPTASSRWESLTLSPTATTTVESSAVGGIWPKRGLGSGN